MLVFIDSKKGIKIQIFNICRSEERVQIDFLQRNHPSQSNGVYEETDKVRTNKQFVYKNAIANIYGENTQRFDVVSRRM